MSDEHNLESPLNSPEWEIENTHPEWVPGLEEHLDKVIDPELGLSILQLGLVRNVAVDGDHAVVTMILTTPFCPYGPSIMESTRKAAENALDIPTKINYGTEVWDPTMMEEGIGDDWGLY